MTFDHKRYIVVGTSDETAEAIKTIFSDKFGRFLAECEVDELTPDELAVLSEHVKEKMLDQYSALY